MPGPLISVLCPTRGRQHLLRESIASLLDTATDPSRVEILVARDPDDDATLEADLPWEAAILTAPQRYGYARIHEYYNALAGMATGEWLFLWNDDCQMLTQGWDQVIGAQSPAILWPEADYAIELNTFPVIPAAWARHLGHLGLDQSVDMWIHHVGLMTGTMRKIPVQVHHAHIEGDATADDRDAAATVNTFWLPGMAEAREKDAARLLELLG